MRNHLHARYYSTTLPSSLYEPPSLELYTVFSKRTYFISFLLLHILHIFGIYLITHFLLKSTPTTLTSLEKFMVAVDQSHFPFSYEDWDEKKGGCLDHSERRRKIQKEFKILTAINLLVNMVLCVPILIICKYCTFVMITCS